MIENLYSHPSPGSAALMCYNSGHEETKEQAPFVSEHGDDSLDPHKSLRNIHGSGIFFDIEFKGNVGILAYLGLQMSIAFCVEKCYYASTRD